MADLNGVNYEELAAALLSQSAKFKTVPSSTPTGVQAHGTGGLFGRFGLSKPIFSSMLLPRTGVLSALPVRYSNETNPLYGIITGVTASTGSNPTGTCDDPPTAGTMKLCTHSFVFGRYSRQTRVFDIESAGQLMNRGEFMDLQVQNTPDGNPFTPTLPGNATLNNAASFTAMKALFELGVAWSRDFAKQVFTGSPTNNTAGGGYKEFYGLESLVNTGYIDAETGITCPSADSLVLDFGSKDVRSNGAAIVRTLQYAYRNLKFLASRAGMDPVHWNIAMPFGLFYELTDIWPIAYSTTAASVVVAGATLFLNSGDQLAMRDAMRGDMEMKTGQYLMIDGERVPVLIDDSIPETQSGATFTSEIFFLPMTVLGNRPVLFLEHFNYDGPGAAVEMAEVFAPGGFFYSSDGGRFLWHRKPPTNTCVQVVTYTRPRLILETPYLAARIANVKYTPLQHENSWDPTSSYWKNGGNLTGDSTAPSYRGPTS